MSEGASTLALKPNTWKFATTQEITTYERTRCDEFEPSDYVIVEMYVEPEDLLKDIRVNWANRIGSLAKKVQVLGFLNMDWTPSAAVTAHSILDRNIIYSKFDPYTGAPYIEQQRYPYLWVCTRKLKLTEEVCRNIPHFHIVRYKPISDEEVAQDLKYFEKTKK